MFAIGPVCRNLTWNLGRHVAFALPGIADGTALGRAEEVLERDVDEGEPRLREQLAGVPELATYVYAPPSLFLDEGAHGERMVDGHGPAVAQEDPPRDDREAVPGRHEPAGLVDERGDEAAVRETGPALMALVKGEGRLVAVRALRVGMGKVEADRIVAAPEAGRVVLRRDAQRSPPRSKWALKKFSEPEVAIAEEAEISSASVAAATIWAKR